MRAQPLKVIIHKYIQLGERDNFTGEWGESSTEFEDKWWCDECGSEFAEKQDADECCEEKK